MVSYSFGYLERLWGFFERFGGNRGFSSAVDIGRRNDLPGLSFLLDLVIPLAKILPTGIQHTLRSYLPSLESGLFQYGKKTYGNIRNFSP